MAARRRTPLHIETVSAHHCSPEVRLQVLGDSPLFSGLAADELARVDSRARSVGFAEGDVVYRQGSSASQLFVVATGVVKTTRDVGGGGSVASSILGPGDFCGALPSLGHTYYHDGAVALTGVCLLAFNTVDFSWVLSRYPAVTRAALEAVSARFAQVSDALYRTGGTVEQRMAATLLGLVERLGQQRRTGTLVHAPLSRADLASLVGARPETVSRILSRWRRAGIVETGRRWVSVVDAAALVRLSSL